MEETKFIDHLKNSFSAIKSHAFFILTLVLIESISTTLSVHYSMSMDDSVVLASAVGSVFVNIILTVIALNIFYTHYKGYDFSWRKSFWDIPTYIFYELSFGLLTFFGAILLVVPGIIVFFYLCFSPIVAILFDDEEHIDEGILRKTKELISVDLKTYTAIFIPFMFFNIVDIIFDKIFSYVSTDIWVSAPFRFIICLLSVICLGQMVSFLNHCLKIKFPTENGHYNQD